MSVYFFKPNVHHAHVNGEVTILDEISDRYILLSEKQTILLSDYMRYGQENSVGKSLCMAGLISTDPGAMLSDSEPSPEGVGLLTWNSSVLPQSEPARLLYLPEAIIRLLIARKRIKSVGLHGCLDNCRNKLSTGYISRHSYEQKYVIGETLSQSIKQAAPFLPGKVKCLESSLALFDMLVARKVMPALFIGFQRYDFLSHAWLEIDNNVISDDGNLKTKLTPIISVTP